jgi:murein DD-endopeptidase MepM/ murein hydrolase activator NlpD
VVADVGLDKQLRNIVAVGLSAVCVAAIVHGCGGRGVYHHVRPGDTLYRIGKAYGVSYEKLAKVNALSDPSRIYVGQKLFIPKADRELPVDIITPETIRATGGAPTRGREIDDSYAGTFALGWPVVGGRITSAYGTRGSSFHDGIDISAPVGTPVKAADDGVVIYSDSLRGYGNVIIVRHANGFATVYAHNHRNWVRQNDKVLKGQVIASVGDSGRTSGPNLHFEVRRDNVARDPLRFLPAKGRAELGVADADAGG